MPKNKGYKGKTKKANSTGKRKKVPDLKKFQISPGPEFDLEARLKARKNKLN